jgi:16S rRNA G527 N7-methylase RsmG
VFHVKQSPEDDSITSYLRQYTQRHNFDIADERMELLATLVSWLAPASHRIGLTKYADPLIMAEQLIAPALLLLNPVISSHAPSPMLDFGAGSGAIGLSLAAVMPLHKIVLADRRRRVVQFLDIAVRRHGLSNCDCLLVDLGNPTNGLANHFGSVLVRAFGPVDEALAGARAWVRPGGTVALWHQPGASGTPDGLTALRTEETELPSLVLTLYQRI